MATLVERGAGPGAGAVAQVRAPIVDAVGRIIFPPGRYDADFIREGVGNAVFGALENSGVIRLEHHGL